MSRKGATRTGPNLSEDLVSAALGDVQMPGQLADFCKSMSTEKANVLRRRRDVDPQDLPVPTQPVPWYELGRRPIGGKETWAMLPSRSLSYAAADFYLQDAGSLLALAAVGADTSRLGDSWICDLCAAPGGKASALVEAVDAAGEDRPRRGFVLANEVIQSRLGSLRLNLARTGSDRYAISRLDPAQLADRLPGVFDVVVVDAPCSGQALLARKKQQSSALSPKQIDHSALRQRRILDAALRLLRDGGKLVYSTCTFAEAENESQVTRLIQSGLASPNHLSHLNAYQSAAGCYRLWPHLHACAGGFAASMTVHQVDSTDSTAGRRTDDTEQAPVDLSQWYQRIDACRLSVLDSVVIGWPIDAPWWVTEVAVGGPEIAHRTGKTWKPSHAGALRRAPLSRATRVIEVGESASTQFLRGQPIACGDRGWHVVRWKQRPLGWIKSDGSTGKNHLPAASRIGATSAVG